MGQHKVHKSSNGANYNKPRPPQALHTARVTPLPLLWATACNICPLLPLCSILLQNEAAESRG